MVVLYSKYRSITKVAAAMKNLFRKIHYSEPLCATEKLAASLIFPTSIFAGTFYHLAAGIRNFLYDIKAARSEKLPAYVISIGNLTTGGTGKTPVTAEIANRLTKAGRRVAVVSRGYGGQLDINSTNVISDGKNIFHSAEQAGDEPFWLAENAPGTVVITGKNRVKSGRLAIAEYKCDVLLVDDGFQHRKLHRDFDIVLIDGANMLGNSLLLPAGPLREPVSGIKRADRVVIVDKTGVMNGKILRLQKDIMTKYGRKLSVCPFAAGEMYDVATGQPAGEVKTAIAFTGIAQPESFFSLLSAKGIKIAGKKAYPDHYAYSADDVRAFAGAAQSTGINTFITTEKDAVKIKPFLKGADAQISVYALKLKVDLDNNVMLNLFQHLSEAGKASHI